MGVQLTQPSVVTRDDGPNVEETGVAAHRVDSVASGLNGSHTSSLPAPMFCR